MSTAYGTYHCSIQAISHNDVAHVNFSENITRHQTTLPLAFHPTYIGILTSAQTVITLWFPLGVDASEATEKDDEGASSDGPLVLRVGELGRVGLAGAGLAQAGVEGVEAVRVPDDVGNHAAQSRVVGHRHLCHPPSFRLQTPLKQKDYVVLLLRRTCHLILHFPTSVPVC